MWILGIGYWGLGDCLFMYMAVGLVVRGVRVRVFEKQFINEF